MIRDTSGSISDGVVRPPAVRRARPDELADVVAVWSRAWLDGHLGHVPEALLAARDSSYFTTQATRRLGTTWVALDAADHVLGIVIIAQDELFQLAVAGSARRGGVGAALLARAEREIYATYSRAWLAVVPGNVRAREFYARHGWLDEGPTVYSAPAAAGPIHVPVHIYAKLRMR